MVNSNSILTVSFPPRVTLANVDAIRQQVRQALENGGSHLVIDLSGVEFMDSSGLGAMVSALKAAKAKGGDVALLAPQPQVRGLIELTRLQTVFPIAGSEADIPALWA